MLGIGFVLHRGDKAIAVGKGPVRCRIQRIRQCCEGIGAVAVIGVGVGDISAVRHLYASVPAGVDAFAFIGAYVGDVGVFALIGAHDVLFILR